MRSGHEIEMNDRLCHFIRPKGKKEKEGEKHIHRTQRCNLKALE